MAYRISQPLAETQFDDDKKKKKKTVKNNDGTVTYIKTKRSGDIKKKTVKDRKKSKGTGFVPSQVTRPIEKDTRTKQQKKEETAIQVAVDKKYGFGDYSKEKKAKDKAIKREKREVKRETIRAERNKPTPKKQKEFKGKPSKNSIKPKRRGGSQQSSCKSSMKSKGRKPCKMNL